MSAAGLTQAPLDAGASRPVERAPEGTAVLEIQVTEEVWGRRHAWEATASRHIPETLQLGLRTATGAVTWGAPHTMGGDSRQRRLL
jgi:hypothetical protein